MRRGEIAANIAKLLGAQETNIAKLLSQAASRPIIAASRRSYLSNGLGATD
jgi:hypothetical protein